MRYCTLSALLLKKAAVCGFRPAGNPQSAFATLALPTGGALALGAGFARHASQPLHDRNGSLVLQIVDDLCRRHATLSVRQFANGLSNPRPLSPQCVRASRGRENVVTFRLSPRLSRLLANYAGGALAA